MTTKNELVPPSCLEWVVHAPIFIEFVWSIANLVLTLQHHIHQRCAAFFYYQVSDCALIGCSILCAMLRFHNVTLKRSYVKTQCALTSILCMVGLIGLLLVPNGHMCSQGATNIESLPKLTFLYIFQLSWPLLCLAILCLVHFCRCCAKSC